jgi:hypothetical protein
MFPILNFDQTNPGLAAAQRMQQMRNLAAQTQQTNIQNQFLPQGLAEQLRGASIGNDLKDVELQYAPQMTQAQLAMLRAQPNLINAQANEANAKVPLYGAQTNLANAEVPYVGMKYAAPYLSAQANLLKAGTGVSNSFRNWSQTPEGSALIQSNPGLAQAVFSAMSGQSGLLNSGMAGGGVPPSLQNLLSSSGSGGAQQPQLPSITLPGTAPAGAAGAASGQPAANMNASMPNNISAVQSASQDTYAKKVETANQRNQQLYASILDNLFQGAQPLMNSVTGYAGLPGRAKLQQDRVQASFGKTSPDYQNYLNFTRNYAPNIANEMRRTLGGQATDNEQKLMASVANPAYWDSNPDMAMQQFKSLQDMYRQRVNPALTQTPSQTRAKLNNSNAAPQSAKNYSDADLQHTAQKYGMTIDQVRQRLGAS